MNPGRQNIELGYLYMVRSGCVIALVGLCFFAARAEAGCRPTVVVNGASELAQPVMRALADRGIATTQQGSCPYGQVVVEKAAVGLQVTIADPHGRHATSELFDAGMAATWIETWVRSDVSSSLHMARPPEREPDLTLGAAYDFRRDSQNHPWHSLRLSGCVRVGKVCAGGQLRVSQTEVFQSVPPQGFITNARRRDIAALVTVALPFEKGRLAISPSAGVGAGFLQTARASCDGSPCLEVNDAAARRTMAPRGEAGAALAFRLTRIISVDISGSVEWLPFARSLGPMLPPLAPDEPPPVQEPTGPGLPDDPLALPAEPSAIFNIGTGVRVAW